MQLRTPPLYAPPLLMHVRPPFSLIHDAVPSRSAGRRRAAHHPPLCTGLGLVWAGIYNPPPHTHTRIHSASARQGLGTGSSGSAAWKRGHTRGRSEAAEPRQRLPTPSPARAGCFTRGP